MLNELEKNKKRDESARKNALSSINPVIKKQSGAFTWRVIYFAIILIAIIGSGWYYREIINEGITKTVAFIKKQYPIKTKAVVAPIHEIPTIKLQNIILEQKNDQTLLDFILNAATPYYIDHASEQQMNITLSNTTLEGNLPVSLENSFIISLNTKQNKNDTVINLMVLPGTKVDELKLIDTPQPHLHLAFSNPQLTNSIKMSKTPAQLSPEQQMSYRYEEILELLAQNNIPEAEMKLHLFIGDFPNHLKARETFVSLLIKEGQFRKADSVLMVGLNKAPNYHPFIKLKAYILMKQNEPNKAIYWLEQQVTTTNDIEYLSLLAALYQQQGHFIRAAELYDQLVKIQPQKTIWWIGLGVALENVGKINAAKEAYQHAYNSADVPPDLMAFLKDKLTK